MDGADVMVQLNCRVGSGEGSFYVYQHMNTPLALAMLVSSFS